jgi:hypothetical protein
MPSIFAARSASLFPSLSTERKPTETRKLNAWVQGNPNIKHKTLHAVEWLKNEDTQHCVLTVAETILHCRNLMGNILRQFTNAF